MDVFDQDSEFRTGGESVEHTVNFVAIGRDDWRRKPDAARLTWNLATSTVERANAAAEQLWGARRGTLAGREHDRAMPAVAGLTAHAATLRKAPALTLLEPLVFWTDRGSQRLQCQLRRHTGEASDGLIEIEIVGAAAAAELVDSSHGPAPGTMLAAAPSMTSQDAATLAEIARMIRGGAAADTTIAPGVATAGTAAEATGVDLPNRQMLALSPPSLAFSAVAATLDLITEPAILASGAVTHLNRACMRLLNEPNDASLQARGGLFAVMPGLEDLVRFATPPESPVSPQVIKPRGAALITLSIERRLLPVAADDPPLLLLTLGTAAAAPVDPTEEEQRQIEFFAKVSHEVRTPLSSIIGFAEVMRGEALGPMENVKYKGYVLDILESARHALSLINDLLDLSRIRAGALTLDPVEMDVNAAIGASLATLQPQAEMAAVFIDQRFGEGLPHLIADRRSVKQMLLNLVGNAIKFTGPGGHIDVSTSLNHDGGIVLAVRDTGAGMSATEAEVALLPFRQVGAVQNGGTGLGLPLTKALAEANGGRLDVSSQPGQGTTMTISFAPGRSIPV